MLGFQGYGEFPDNSELDAMDMSARLTDMPDCFLVHQFTRTHSKRLCQLLNHGDGGIATPTLDIADIGPVDAGAVGKILLAPAFGLAQAANVLTQARDNIHAKVKTAMSAIDLQTMSDTHG